MSCQRGGRHGTAAEDIDRHAALSARRRIPADGLMAPVTLPLPLTSAVSRTASSAKRKFRTLTCPLEVCASLLVPDVVRYEWVSYQDPAHYGAGRHLTCT